MSIVSKILQLAQLTSTKIWVGDVSNKPAEQDKPVGDMAKSTYDPNEDGVIALAQLDDAVCSEDEAATIAATTAPKASNTVRNSNDAVREGAGAGYIKRKECKLNANLAVCRIKFDLRSGSSGKMVFGKLYKNDNPIGIERSTDSTSFQTFSEDFSGLVTDDLIQLYLKNEVTVGTHAKGANFRFCYSEFITHIGGLELVAALEDTADPTISITNQDP